MSSRLLLLGLALGTAAPALAQQAEPQAKGTPSVEAYLCTFAGKCAADTAPQAERDAPATKGFRFARPTAAAVPAPASQPERGATALHNRALVQGRTARRRYAPAPAQSGYAAVGARPAAMAPGAIAANVGRPRADLMIGFEYNSARLTAEGVSAAQVFARSMMMPELQGKRFLIEGHTDRRGGQALNAQLSARRADAVAEYLVSQGVARNRLDTRGLGASSPLPGHRSSDPANRRVEAELIS
jgi:outer membrane protein OmpA-like peptidoglycan-associated protein